jgi:hypothetical protein
LTVGSLHWSTRQVEGPRTIDDRSQALLIGSG